MFKKKIKNNGTFSNQNDRNEILNETVKDCHKKKQKHAL